MFLGTEQKNRENGGCKIKFTTLFRREQQITNAKMFEARAKRAEFAIRDWSVRQ